MEDIIRTHVLYGLKIALVYIVITILVLCAATYFKKHQYAILWISGIVLLVISFLCCIFGVLIPHRAADFMVMILSIMTSGVYVMGAEHLRKKQRQMKGEATVSSDIDERSEVEPQFPDTHKQPEEISPKVQLTVRLNTPLAENVFAKALEAGIITEEDGHYRKNRMSKVLLAYMCGRIYCGDTSYEDKTTKKRIWKQGPGIFPDSDLNELFGEENLAQSRSNRCYAGAPNGYDAIDRLF